MGLLDSIIGSVLGNTGNAGALQSVLGSILSGQGRGLPGLVDQFHQAGLGNVIGSWIGTGANQQVDPNALHQVFGQQQVDQWAQQTGMSHDDVLSSLSKLLPHAVDQSTPDGELPQASPFDAPGLELKQ